MIELKWNEMEFRGFYWNILKLEDWIEIWPKLIGVILNLT